MQTVGSGAKVAHAGENVAHVVRLVGVAAERLDVAAAEQLDEEAHANVDVRPFWEGTVAPARATDGERHALALVESDALSDALVLVG